MKGPTYHSTHRKEQRSKADFEKLFDPCIVNWLTRDYGVDCLVTLYSSKKNGSVELDSTHFHVQLKSTAVIKGKKDEFSFGVSTSKISDWAKSNVNLLLVINDLSTGHFYGRWIDNDFLSELSRNNSDWITKKTISVKFNQSHLISPVSIDTIRAYLLSKKANQVKILPGQYFILRDKVKALLENYEKIQSPFDFNSTRHTLEILNAKLELAIYRIAIAGPSRAGKSTLINALLQKDISPTGIFQTTGVPIQIIPGKKNQITIYLKDGTKINKQFSEELITNYASQNQNLNNHKKVKFVSVEIVNTQLEKGVSFFDVPGLDDPDDEILQHTASYVRSFNAVVYVIDVTPHATGGFAIKSEFKKQITELSSTLDKVFLIFNKVDFLTLEQLNTLKERINFDLKRLGLLDKIDSKIHFTSAKNSFDLRIKKKGSKEGDLLNPFESNLWSYLLDGNKAGVYRLLDITNELYQLQNDFSDLLNTRLINSSTLDKLHEATDEIRNKLPELLSMFKLKQKDIKSKIKFYLGSQKSQLLINLETFLKQVPPDKSLPGDSDLKKFILNEINNIIEQSNETCLHQGNGFKMDVDIWIEGNLRKLREIINSSLESRTIDISPIETMKIPEVDLSSSWGMGLLGGIIGFVINPYAYGAVIGGAVIAFVGSLFFSAETRRALKIVKVLESTRNKCDIVFSDLITKFDQGIDDILLSVIQYANEKINLYFSDINSQIQAVKTGRLTNEEKIKYQNCFQDLEKMKHLLNDTANEITQYK
jgi:GTPase Era involved in 16S rRNA processing